MKNKQTNKQTNKSIRFLKLFCLTIFGVFLLISCENQENLEKNSEKFTTKVSEEDALSIAGIFPQKNNETNPNSRGIDLTKTIRETITVKTDTQVNSFYIINYNEGGFVIIAADNRISPILAYNDTGDFTLDGELIPESILEWIKDEKELTKYVIYNQLIQKPEIKLEWDYISNLLPPINTLTCEDTFIEKGPLMTTNWGQKLTYNDLVSHNCPNDYTGKAPTGCIATAMAQIMRYHRKPSTYNWNNMPNNQGTIDTQKLMRDIGQNWIDYGCDVSSQRSNNIPLRFLMKFGYGSNYTDNYRSSVVTENINRNKPVILSGGRKKNGLTWPWSTYTDGHAWVCDGYRDIMIHYRDDLGNCTGEGVGYVWLHMNWGWNGQNNGWYNAHNFNPGTYTFNYRNSIVYNITP